VEWCIGRLLELIDEHAPGSHAYLNLVLTGGANAAACRFSTDPDCIDSLYVNDGGRYRCVSGDCEMTPPSDVERAVLISSEPLSRGPRWKALGRNQLVTVSADFSVAFRDVSLPSLSGAG
jgi:predicted glutamine amidotransferase